MRRVPGGVTADDQALLSEMEHSIARLDVGRVPVLRALLEPLQRLLGAAYANAYGLRVDDHDAVRVAFMHTQFAPTIEADLDGALATAPKERWTNYNPRAPEPDQRNRALAVAPTARARAHVWDVCRKYGTDRPQIRALVCEGPCLLAWVGGFRDDPATTRELWLLDQLVPSLRNRLALERRLEASAATAITLELALEHIANAAFVLTAGGQLLHANSAGRARLEHDGKSLLRQLAGSLREADPAFEVHGATGNGMPSRYLVVAKSHVDRAHAMGAVAAARWHLTPRQREVLVCILRGHSNARISAELGISERTVEVHVTAIFDRAQCASRAELMAVVLATD